MSPHSLTTYQAALAAVPLGPDGQPAPDAKLPPVATPGDEAWRYGHVLPLAPEDDSPFLGALRPGEARLCAQAGEMFRAPAAAHAPLSSDFLLIRR